MLAAPCARPRWIDSPFLRLAYHNAATHLKCSTSTERRFDSNYNCIPCPNNGLLWSILSPFVRLFVPRSVTAIELPESVDSQQYLALVLQPLVTPHC